MNESAEIKTPTWLGFSDPVKLSADGKEIVARLGDSARDGRWATVFSILYTNDALLNLCRPGGTLRFAPLHQAAYQGDKVATAELIRRGAWMGLRANNGERASETARRRGHGGLAMDLIPPVHWSIPEESIRALEFFLHAVIRIRANDLVQASGLRLPPIEPLTAMIEPTLWFPVTGMYGGFSLRLLRGGTSPVLMADSWCRVASGSEERHIITTRGVQRMDDPFVDPDVSGI